MCCRHASLAHAHRNIASPFRRPIATAWRRWSGTATARRSMSGAPRSCCCSADGVGTRRDHAAHRQVEDLRLALAGALRRGRRRRAAARQDAALAHPAARARGRRTRGGADARRTRRGETTHWTRRHDGEGGRHQRQRGAAHLEGARAAAAPLAAVQALQRSRTSSTSCATSSGSMSIRRRTPSCCRSTRRARSRRSTAPSPACR